MYGNQSFWTAFIDIDEFGWILLLFSLFLFPKKLMKIQLVFVTIPEGNQKIPQILKEFEGNHSVHFIIIFNVFLILC